MTLETNAQAVQWDTLVTLAEGTLRLFYKVKSLTKSSLLFTVTHSNNMLTILWGG